MSRSGALLRLAAAYGRHQVMRRLRGRQAGLDRLRDFYAEDRLLSLDAVERDLLPAAAGCINCGLCALVAARVSGLRPSDLASAYLRDYPRLDLAAGDWGAEPEAGAPEALRSAAEACPAGVPLAGVFEVVRRLAST